MHSHYFVVWMNVVLTLSISFNALIKGLLYNNNVITQHSFYCNGAFFATEEISNLAGRWLRFARHDRCQQGNGFLSWLSRSHCEGAFFATEEISNPAGRWLRFARHDRCQQGNGFLGWLSRSHCEGAFFATEEISNPAGRWLR